MRNQKNLEDIPTNPNIPVHYHQWAQPEVFKFLTMNYFLIGIKVLNTQNATILIYSYTIIFRKSRC